MCRSLLLLTVLILVVLGAQAPARPAPPDSAKPKSAQDIARMLLSGGDDWNRALGILRSDKRGEQWIRELVEHQSPRVRLDAIRAIRDERLRDFEGMLRSLLADPVEEVWLFAWARLHDAGQKTVEVLRESLRKKRLPAGVIGVLGPVWLPSGSNAHFDWSPNGEYLAAATTDGTVRIWNVSTSEIETRLRAPGGRKLGGLLWSPDGRALGVVVSGLPGILVWRRGTDGHWSVSDGLDRVATTAEQLAWWPSQRSIVSGVQHCLVAWDLESGKLRSRAIDFKPPPAGRQLRLLVASPQGDLLAAVSGKHVLIFRSIEESKVLISLNSIGLRGASVPYPSDLAWAPEGDRLAIIGPYGNVGVWDVATRRRIWLSRVEAESGPAMDVSWSPDSLRIAQGTRTGIMIRHALTGEPLEEYTSSFGRVAALKWSPNGRWIATNGPRGVILVWKLPPSPQALDRKAAEVLLRAPESDLPGSLDVLWRRLDSPDLQVSGKAERVLAALGDPAAEWIADRIREHVGIPAERPVTARLLRAVSALAASVGQNVETTLKKLLAAAGGTPELERMLRWAIETRTKELSRLPTGK